MYGATEQEEERLQKMIKKEIEDGRKKKSRERKSREKEISKNLKYI